MADRVERMRHDADVAEGRRFIGDIGEGLRAHVEGTTPQAQAAQGTDQLDADLAEARRWIQTPGMGVLLDSYLDIVRIARQLAAAYPDEPGMQAGIRDILGEIAHALSQLKEARRWPG